MGAMSKAVMSIFRAKDAPEMTGDDGHFETPPPGAFDGWTAMFEAGLSDGTVCKKLFDLPGFSRVYNWFKPHFLCRAIAIARIASTTLWAARCAWAPKSL